MSGETVRLAGDPFVVRALEALGGPPPPRSLPDHAVVGGLAVMVRLEQTHRATGDVDLVSSDEARTIELLVDNAAVRTRSGVRLQLDVDIDVIDAVDPGVDPTTAHDDIERNAIENQIAFAHALRCATVVGLSASAPDIAPTSVELRVATTADLVVLKLHSTLDPRRAPMKRGSDLYDLARLLLQHGTATIIDALATAPSALRTSVLERAQVILIDDADRSAATLRRSNVRGVEIVSAEQLESLGHALVEAISRPDAPAG